MDRLIKGGSTDVSVHLYIIDVDDGTPLTGLVFDSDGMDLRYRREGAVVVAIVEADLVTPALDDPHLDGGFLEVGNGVYRLDLPDAVCAAGAGHVSVFGTVTGGIVLPVEIQLVAFDPDDGVRAGLTALPNAAADGAGGLPISDAGGLDLDAQIGTDVDAILADTNELQTDWTDGGRLDLILDGLTSSLTDLYHADIDVRVSDDEGYDRWTVRWYKNGVPLTAGITVPKITVEDRTDSSTLINDEDMADVGTGEFLYVADSIDDEQMTKGLPYEATVTATIDGSSRTFRKLVGRDI